MSIVSNFKHVSREKSQISHNIRLKYSSMARLTIALLFFSLLIHAHELSSSQQKPYFLKEKITHLRFYLQDLVGGENRTVWQLAQLNFSNTLPSSFGRLLILDNLVTISPDYNSGEIGRMQGLVGLAGYKEEALVMLVNLVFTTGKYKGSTLSILGRNPLLEEVREVPVVGGTGAFRMARGFVVTRTKYSTHDYGIYEYDVTIAHLDDDGLSEA